MDKTSIVLAKILTNIKNYLDEVDRSKLFQECKNLSVCISKYSINAMIVYRIRKISHLPNLLPDNIEYLKREIDELIRILINLISWECKICGKTIEAEQKNQLTLWIKAHKTINNH
jgi:hypothetical protein